MQIETARLLIRPWRETDAEHYLKIADDVGYNCFAPPGYFLAKDSAAAVEKIRPRIQIFEETGLGKFPLFLRSTGSIIGTCGIEPYPGLGPDAVELGYRLRLNFWELGYATEAAKAVVQYGFRDLKLPKIYAFAVPQNRASLGVIRKLGFQSQGMLEHAGIPHELYVKLPPES
jgi:ribosomal-protein-alanine N-acetyltransferase